MQAILAFLGANAGFVSIGALALSVFCAGSMLQGERVRKEEIKEQLREIEARAEQSRQRVSQIQAQLAAEDERLVAQIDSTYARLAAINTDEVRRRKTESDRRLRQANSANDSVVNTINDLGGFSFKKN